jgi:hypothetical protein
MQTIESGTRRSAVRQIRLGSRSVPVTPAFDTYWRFAAERQRVFLNRVAQKPPPWTEDPIIAGHRFTNVYRASDRVSQYLIREVIYTGPQTEDEVFFRTMLFKLFNRIGTWEHLRTRIGELSWKAYSFERYSQQLDQLFASREKVYSAAYIMPSPAFGERRKHANHLRLLEHMMHDGAPRKVASASSLKAVFDLLRSYRSLGDFLAFQLTIDLNYSAMIDFSEMDFVIAGPGAHDGIRKCFLDAGGLQAEEIIKLVAEIADTEFRRLGLAFQSLWGRPLQLIDCQNVFCELSKYARVAHPEIEGTPDAGGSSRSTRRRAPPSRSGIRRNGGSTEPSLRALAKRRSQSSLDPNRRRPSRHLEH